jgi:penicillin amidase
VYPGQTTRKNKLSALLLHAAMTAALCVVAYAAIARAEVNSETVPVDGIAAPVEILIDEWGVPHIFAQSQDDLFFAQGWNAARDRLWQIDLWRRRGLGELSAVLGDSYVEQDRAARLFVYRGDMDAEWASYGPQARRITERFVDGINAYIDWLELNPDRLPLEFKLLHYKPARWKPADIVRIRSNGPTRNVEWEVERAKLACAGGLAYDEVLHHLEPRWTTELPRGLDPCLPPDVLKTFKLAVQSVTIGKQVLRKAGATTTRFATDETAGEERDGSNGWVVSPSRSATGRPILANDPHRVYSTPSLRYLAHLSAPGLDVVGAGEPALPGVSFGHNDRIAFGITIFAIDQEDLYAYELNPNNPRQYKYKEGWEDMRIVREDVAVKNEAPRTVELAFTRHGPVIYVDTANNRAYAVRTARNDAGMAPYFAAVRTMYARNWNQFVSSVENWGSPSLNFVYADVDGNVGWATSGFAPNRPNWDGLLPVPGDGRYEWAGRRPGASLPRALNPREGWIATANQFNLGDDDPAARGLGFEWVNPGRYRRIVEVLSKLDKIGIEDSMRLQTDESSVVARRMGRILEAVRDSEEHVGDERARLALERLAGFDGNLARDSGAAALYEVWLARHLGNAFKSAVLPPAAAQAIAWPDPATLVDWLENPADRFGGDDVNKRNRLVIETLSAAYAEMERLQGPDPKLWAWGKLHHSMPEHPLAGAVDDAVAARLNAGQWEKGGDFSTPNQSTYRATDFRQTVGSSVRLVLDVGSWDAGRAVNYPGQSGDTAGPHYRDLAQLWSTGRFFPLLFSHQAIEQHVERRIVLSVANH